VVDENSDYDLLCKVAGDPAPEVEWLKDGVRYREQTVSFQALLLFLQEQLLYKLPHLPLQRRFLNLKQL